MTKLLGIPQNGKLSIGGGGGGSAKAGPPGGGGGAYAAQTNVQLTAGGIATYQIGAGGAAQVSGTDSFFKDNTNTTVVLAKFGVGASGVAAGQAGGAAASCTGSTKFSGGTGGTAGGPSPGGGGRNLWVPAGMAAAGSLVETVVAVVAVVVETAAERQEPTPRGAEPEKAATTKPVREAEMPARLAMESQTPTVGAAGAPQGLAPTAFASSRTHTKQA